MEKAITITICIGSSCHLKGSHDVVKILQRLVAFHRLEKQVSLVGSFCMGQCTSSGVCTSIGGEQYKVTPGDAEQFFNEIVLKTLQE